MEVKDPEWCVHVAYSLSSNMLSVSCAVHSCLSPLCLQCTQWTETVRGHDPQTFANLTLFRYWKRAMSCSIDLISFAVNARTVSQDRQTILIQCFHKRSSTPGQWKGNVVSLMACHSWEGREKKQANLIIPICWMASLFNLYSATLCCLQQFIHRQLLRFVAHTSSLCHGLCAMSGLTLA